MADAYLDPGSSGATRESAAVVFEAFNRYAGVGVGEHLGCLFTGLWTVMLALAILRLRMFGRLGRPFGLFGVVAAAGILFGTLEPAGVGLAAEVVTFAYLAWSAWLVAFGLLLLILVRPGTYPVGAAPEGGGRA